MPRRVCIVTGTRAEYGLLKGLMGEIRQDPDLELQVIATGMHLSPEFGMTVREIEEDGFDVDERVEMLLSSDSPVGIAKSMGLGTIGIADALDRLQPDVFVVLGDRFEALAAAQAALVARIPIAHIHGGETTEGAVDESIRHAITKMATLHFVAAAPFRRRVVQMGEHPERVVESGAPGLDFIRQVDVMSRDELSSSLDLKLGDPTFLITYHPATLQDRDPGDSVDELLHALDRFPGASLVFTKANADAHGRVINERIEAYARSRDGARLYDSLGQRRYVSALHHADVVVGNSSSGIIEAPAIPVPTVNLGDRQKGRLRAESVIDCAEEESAIADAIETALSDAFRQQIADVPSPYGDGRAAPRIKEHLKAADLSSTRKAFYDLPVELSDAEPPGTS